MIAVNKNPIRIGIDLGGTKIEMIALDSEGQVLKQQRIPTPRDDYSKIIRSISDLVFSFENEFDQKSSVGIGMPGAISRVTGQVKNSNSVCLNGKPFKQDLEELLKRTIKIENDANCFALSEATDGVAVDGKVVFGVILGTGVGGGLVINKEIINGPNSISGEWGHNSLPWPDEQELLIARECYCGKNSCIETWLCGEGLSHTFSCLSDQKFFAENIVEKANNGEKIAGEALAQYYRRLAKSLASVINILDPDVIVLGGGLSNIKQIYSEVPQLWNEYVFSDRVDTHVSRIRGKLGISAEEGWRLTSIYQHGYRLERVAESTDAVKH